MPPPRIGLRPHLNQVSTLLIGHYAAGFAAKVASPTTPLWLLLLGAQLVDVAWVTLVLADVEQLKIVAGFTQSNNLENVYIPYTHGFLPSLLWVIVAALLFRFVRARTALTGSAVAIGFVVGSHWLLDLIVHVPDLPLVGDSYKVGFGLWDSRWLAFTLELSLVVGAGFWWASYYGRAAYLFVSVLGLMCVANYFGPLPTTVLGVVLAASAVYLVVTAAAYFGERLGWFRQHR